MDRKKIKAKYLETIENLLRNEFMKSLEDATAYELYYAVAKISMNEVTKAWKKTEIQYRFCQIKQINYLTMEVLPGRLLGNNLRNSGTKEIIEALIDEVLVQRKINLDFIEDQEDEPALGNGGLGRLSACILESLTTQGYNVCGHSLRYKKGLFKQKIIDGRQVELPDFWEKDGYPLGILRKDLTQYVIFGSGSSEKKIIAIPFDVPIVGYPITGFEDVKVTSLRLWDAVNDPEITESLYPSDKTAEGKKIRLKQQYFLSSASIQQIVSQYKTQYQGFERFTEKIAVHINDTHPAIAIPELMRVLMDENGLSWDKAWGITTKCCSYTNHTLMKEALETWSVDLFKNLLPRVYAIIEEIDRRFVKKLREDFADSEDKVKSMAVLYDDQVRMANLAIIGSASINGVAKVHTDILKNSLFKDFYKLMDNKFKNITNGVTHRQFLYDANPMLSSWLNVKCRHSRWITDMSFLKNLETFADDSNSQFEFLQIKYKNKEILAEIIRKNTGIIVDPKAIFDVQVKRQHEYKRQLMNVLRIRYLYNLLKSDKRYLDSFYPMVFIFAGKAHPDYKEAKQIITEICKLADVVNNDLALQGKIKVVFLENYNVSLAKKIFPGSDVSEQISTASKEASGTGNMKFMMNGALTLGTMDGANIEIMEAVGKDNMFIFGALAEEIMELETTKAYNAKEIYLNNENIQRVVDSLDSKLKNSLINQKDGNEPTDRYFVLLDLLDYVETTCRLNKIYKDTEKWAHMAIMNVANSGRFSIDRTVHEYVKEVWHAESIYED